MNIGQSIQTSFDLYRQNFGVLILATMLTTLISVASIGILAGPMIGGLLIICLKLMRGEKAEVNEVFAYFDKFGATFLIVAAMWAAMLVIAIISYIPVLGFVFQLVAGPVVGLIFILAIGLTVERNLEPVAALQQACRVFMADLVGLWMYSFVIGVLSMCGMLIFLFPLFLTLPLGITGMAVAYRELFLMEIKEAAETEAV